MRGYIFTLEAILAIAVATILLGVLHVPSPPHATLALHVIAEDSLSILKRSGRLQTQDPSQIEYLLNATAPLHRLTIYRYDQSAQLQSNKTIGKTPGTDTTVARATWVDSTSYYLAILEVWQ